MKKITYFMGLIAGCLGLASCEDYLDRTPDDKTTEQQVFTRYEQVEELVTDLYAHAKYACHPLIYFNHFSIFWAVTSCFCIYNCICKFIKRCVFHKLYQITP